MSDSPSDRHPPAWFVRWYMGRVAGRCCPCEWPVKVKSLIRLCAWLDDEYARLDFFRFADCWTTNTTDSTFTKTFAWRRENGR